MSRFKRGVGVGARSELASRPGLAARFWVPILGGAWLSSCGALAGNDAELGGETHFLVTCEAGCGPGLSCIGGACTQRCEPGGSSCAALFGQASCIEVPDFSADVAILAGTCDVPCAGDADCTALGDEHSCRAGVCRATPAQSQTASLAAPLTRAVSTDMCRSRLLWAGESRPSAEMLPGSDCVGCHEQTGALPLAIGGTVYPIGGLQDQPEPDACFGVEGVEVTVVDAEGRERRTYTNRAGNFYFEGAEAGFPMPYEATIRWKSFEGDVLRTPMGTMPSYGGCARCHSPSAVEVLDRDNPRNTIIPAGPIFTPGLYRD